jgi:hypothetical protein
MNVINNMGSEWTSRRAASKQGEESMQWLAKKRMAIATMMLIAAIIGFTVFKTFSRKDTLEVLAIDDGYDIRITSSGRSVFPFVDGPGLFPEWSVQTRLQAQGDGEKVQIDGLPYKKYSVDKDLKTMWFSSGVIYISEEAKRLVVKGELCPDRYYHINHSGTYDNIRIDRPRIHLLSENTKIDDIDGCFIRAKGRSKGWKFEAMGITFEPNDCPWLVENSIESENSLNLEVIGRVSTNSFTRSKQEPCLLVVSYKIIEEKPR